MIGLHDDRQVAAPLMKLREEWRACSTDQNYLDAIRRPGIELALWTRSLSPCLSRWLAGLRRAQLPDLTLVAHRSMEPGLLASLMASTPSGPMRDLLAQDVCALAARYAVLTGRAFVTLRLERITDDACKRFHRDASQFRLFTTYRGMGTEYVAPQNADAAVRDQRAYRGPIERLAPESVAIWKGAAAGARGGLVHRSPAMRRSDVARLILCVDAPLNEHA